MIRLGDDLAELKTGLLRLDEDLEELSLVLEESISEDGERQNGKSLTLAHSVISNAHSFVFMQNIANLFNFIINLMAL